MTVHFQKGDISGTTDVDLTNGEIRIVLRFDKDPVLAALLAPMLCDVVGNAVTAYCNDSELLPEILALRK